MSITSFVFKNQLGTPQSYGLEGGMSEIIVNCSLVQTKVQVFV